MSRPKMPVIATARYTSVVTVNGRDSISGETPDGREVFIAIPRTEGETESSALRRMIRKLETIAAARESTESRNREMSERHSGPGNYRMTS